MTLDALIMLSGALVAALPFLGFPNSWDTAILFALGIFVIALGITVRRREKDGSAAPASSAPLAEHTARAEAPDHGQS